ncbi:hypothetical protein AAFF_G00111240 [Aldrovandia affinis]|uniref:Uncharacterized protein n=1 Tax=Aldrovandia affinis TaxID=143900 RepID=A0AAD7RTT5_9TELE|nr:hypothetical protein AAFF_G00111240 [Aldrovandia affinis]
MAEDVSFLSVVGRFLFHRIMMRVEHRRGKVTAMSCECALADQAKVANPEGCRPCHPKYPAPTLSGAQSVAQGRMPVPSPRCLACCHGNCGGGCCSVCTVRRCQLSGVSYNAHSNRDMDQ